MGKAFSLATDGLWKSRALGGRDECIPIQELHYAAWLPAYEDVMHAGYRPKMLLYALDAFFYVFDQVRQQWGVDKKIVIAYEILCLSTM